MHPTIQLAADVAAELPCQGCQALLEEVAARDTEIAELRVTVDGLGEQLRQAERGAA